MDEPRLPWKNPILPSPGYVFLRQTQYSTAGIWPWKLKRPGKWRPISSLHHPTQLFSPRYWTKYLYADPTCLQRMRSRIESRLSPGIAVSSASLSRALDLRIRSGVWCCRLGRLGSDSSTILRRSRYPPRSVWLWIPPGGDVVAWITGKLATNQWGGFKERWLQEHNKELQRYFVSHYSSGMFCNWIF